MSVFVIEIFPSMKESILFRSFSIDYGLNKTSICLKVPFKLRQVNLNVGNSNKRKWFIAYPRILYSFIGIKRCSAFRFNKMLKLTIFALLCTVACRRLTVSISECKDGFEFGVWNLIQRNKPYSKLQANFTHFQSLHH